MLQGGRDKETEVDNKEQAGRSSASPSVLSLTPGQDKLHCSVFQLQINYTK